MTETESEIQYRCPPGMRVLRVADVVQIQGGPAVVVKVSECNATVLPMWGTKKVIVNKFDGTEIVINAQRGPVAVSNNMEPSQILQHMTDTEYQEFLAARTPAKRSESKPTNNQAGEEQEEVMAVKKYKKSVADKAVTESTPKSNGKVAGAPSAKVKREWADMSKRVPFIDGEIAKGTDKEAIIVAVMKDFFYTPRGYASNLVENRIKKFNSRKA